jgi:hypothetical protein
MHHGVAYNPTPPAFGTFPTKGKKSKIPSGGKKQPEFGKKQPAGEFGKKDLSTQDKKRSEIWADALTKIVTRVFTQEQKDKWRELSGTPVRVEIHFDYFDGLGMRHPMMSMNPPGHGPRLFPQTGDRERERKGHDR